MRAGFVASVIAAVFVTIVPAVGAAEGCVGLTCEPVGSPNDVPEARDPSVPSVWGPRQLDYQHSAGFYEFGQGTLSSERAVGYVVPRGQLNRMPASVRDLPAVVAIEQPGGHPGFDFGTIIIVGPDVVMTVPPERAASPARKSRARAKSAAVDGYGCEEYRLCLYDHTGWSGRGIMFGPATPDGWHNLSQWGWNDDASSQRNRRNNDSLIAEHTYGGGARYCADSHTVDSSFNNNSPNNDEASSIRNQDLDNWC
jgi:hypothetical protein